MSYEDVTARIDALRSEIEELSALEEPTEEQVQRLDAAIGEADEAIVEARACEAREAKLAEIRTFAAKPGHVESGDGARVAPVPGAKTRNIYDMTEARNESNSPEAFAAEIRSRAETAIERDSDPQIEDWKREQATRLMQKGLGRANGDPHGTAVAERWLNFGTPEYRDLFKRALGYNDTAAINEMAQITQRAAWNEGTTTQGQFAVVPEYDLTLLLVNDGTTNPWRRISRVHQTNAYKWNGLSSAGVTAEWMTESTEASDATPTFAQPSVSIYREDAYLQASFEIVADSDLGSEVSRLIADGFDRLEATAFALGTGGGQPYGVITRVAAVSGARVAGSSGAAGAADLVAADIFAVDNALAPRYRNGAVWVANKATYNAIRRLAIVPAGYAAGAMWTDLGGGRPGVLIGYDAYESSDMDSTIVSGSNDDVLILGKFGPDLDGGYVIVDRIGMSMAFNPLVLGSNRRPTGEVGWYAIKRVGADVIDSTNCRHFKLLRL